MKALAQKLETAVRGRVSLEEPLAPRTTIRLGGRAALWFEPRDAQDLVAGLRLFREEGVTPTTLGGGAATP